MQHEVTRPQPLLNSQGHISEPGFSRFPVWDYRRKDIHAPRFRIKEWDYYLITNERYGVAFTISDLGYLGLISVSFLNFEERWEHTETILDLFPMGRYRLGHTSAQGNARFQNKRLFLEYRVTAQSRKISCRFPSFFQGMDFSADILLHQPDMESMCIATPWKESPACFYYNQKLSCLPAEGTLRLGPDIFCFSPKQDFGTLDWGRGVWTWRNTWYWGTGTGLFNGVPLGFNLGYGFSDRSSATENVIFYDGKIHKLSQVDFGIPTHPDGSYDFLKPWHITSDNRRLEGIFKPVLDRKSKINVLAVSTDQHQVFGHFSGTAILDDGTALKVKKFFFAVEIIKNLY